MTGHVIELDLGPVVALYEFGFDDSRVTGKISPSLQVLNHLQYLNLNFIDFQSNPFPNTLASMSNLQQLHVSNASLTGPIPHQLVNLSNLLYLDLSRNSLGSIPFSLGDLTSLTYLNLSQNLLGGGVIPKSFGNCSSLVHLDLSQNHFSRSFPSFAGCSSLTNLSLAHNSLSGSIPDFIQCTSLKYLDLSSNLSSNHLFGNVPNSVGQVSNLRFLDFSSNSLEGVISEIHLLNLTQLLYLDLSFNSLALDSSVHGRIVFQLSTIKLQSCKLGPRFPVWIKTQKHFTHLDISNAGISDSVPDWFWDLPLELNFLNISSNEIEGILPDMTYIFDVYPGMDLSNNHFKGRVPSLPSLATLNLSGNRFSGTLSFLCNFDSALTFLDLSNNLLSGSLPDCWLNFQEKLVVLNLSNNNLSGKIPSSLGFLYNLEALYLRANTFVGEVPMSLRNCRRLRFVDLGENKLSGNIPKWIGEELSELYVLVLGSNRFYGMLPSQVCWLYNLQVLDLSNNGSSGNLPRCFDNFTAMSKIIFGGGKITNHSYSSFTGRTMCISLHFPCTD
ncbi:hypothetical protein L1987_75298 [Smallanthus sonchifolius]|uniref:Uncharacterized protein n=1 Tax=Smallanthus sonchifolius TaxID=185202 RepID=A0ACB9A526_9ASTR|nr:hypothetical protein L1987_75298 [Smallanthus sonchifolius]